MTGHKVLALDVATAGISGDMFVSGLINLYERIENETAVEILLKSFSEKLNSLNPEFINISLKLESKSYQGFNGYKLIIENEKQKIKIKELQEYTSKLLKSFEVGSKYEKIGSDVIEILLDAEKHAHETDHIHLHELGMLDTVIDIVLPMIIMSKLEIETIQLSPIALGNGTVSTAHGVLPIPPPAVAHIAQEYNFKTIAEPDGGEATTPTGLALVAALQRNLTKAREVIWKNTGYGYGTREWSDRGNFLRVRLGHPSSTASSVKVLETNIDDVSAEILGNVIDELMQIGALDVSYYPILMKKGRPAYCLRVISKDQDCEAISEEIMRLTGTLGVRVFNIDRHIGERNIYTIKSRYNDTEINFDVKYSKYNIKIEYEDLKRLSDQFAVSPLLMNKQLLNLDEVQNLLNKLIGAN